MVLHPSSFTRFEKDGDAPEIVRVGHEHNGLINQAKLLQHKVEETAVRIEHGHHDAAEHNPRNEVGHVGHGLHKALEARARNLIDEKGKCDGCQNGSRHCR